MKSMDSYGLKMSGFQTEFFEKSVSYQECSSGIFIRRFMCSGLASRIDSDGFYLGAMCIENAFEDLEEQYGASQYGQIKYSEDEMYWTEYIYRYWAYPCEISSRLFKYLKPEKLRFMYFPYHSPDLGQADDRIPEAEGTDNDDPIARCAEIMRRIRNKPKNEK